MDKSKFVGLLFLDLSKAFDLVSHDIVLSRIAKYHASEPTWRCFKSYLYDRTQTCAISGLLSNPLTLPQGVPQGSILAPVLFPLYINDRPLCLPTSDVEIYADDTTLLSSGHSIDHIQNNLQDSLNNASCWLKLNKMVPNTKKTKHLLIATRQKLEHAKNPTLNLHLNGNPIEEAKDEKLLGVKIDKHICSHNHIEYLIAKLNSRIHLLKVHLTPKFFSLKKFFMPW